MPSGRAAHLESGPWFDAFAHTLLSNGRKQVSRLGSYLTSISPTLPIPYSYIPETGPVKTYILFAGLFAAANAAEFSQIRGNFRHWTCSVA